MSGEEAIQVQEMLAALERYFNAATDDDAYNASIIRSDLERYGGALVPMGLAYIARSLQQLGSNTEAFFSLNQRAGNELIVSDGFRLMVRHASLIGACGEMGITRLVIDLGFDKEDIVALAACQLANKRFVRASSLPQLRTAFRGAYGTGCRIALALALYRHGDKEPFKELAHQFFMKRLPPDADEAAQSQVTQFTFAHVALDIASGGRAYPALSTPARTQWRKKQ